MQLCSAGWESRTWVPGSWWGRKGMDARRCWRRSLSLLRPRQVQRYVETSSSKLLLPNPLPGAQKSWARVVWSLDGLLSKPKPFGAPYSSLFLPLQGASALQLQAFLSSHDTSNIFWRKLRCWGRLAMPAGTLKEKHKVAHLLQYGIDLALLLRALESSPVTSVWHQRNVFMPLLSVAGQHWQGRREVWDLAWFSDMLQGRLRVSTEKYRVYRQDNNPSQSTDLDLREHRYNRPGSAICCLKANVRTTIKNNSKSTDDPEIHYL